MSNNRAQELAQNIYDAQSVTADEYPSIEAYVNDLIELADDNGWTEGIDRDELRRHLTRLAS